MAEYFINTELIKNIKKEDKDNFEDYEIRHTRTRSNKTNIPVRNTMTNPGTPMENNVTVKQVKTAWSFFSILFLILSLLFLLPFCVLSAYLSWYSNSLIDWCGGFKFVFALFAFFFPFTYLIKHLVHKYDVILHINKNNELFIDN